MNCPIKFFDRDNKIKLVPASFSDFLGSVIVKTVIISVHYKKAN